MKTIKILRYYSNQGNLQIKDNKFLGSTIGAVIDTDRTTYPPICYSLERPLFVNGNANKQDDKKTKINDSGCILTGEYEVRWTYSNTFKREMYLLMNTFERSGIRIHSATDINDLLGCIGLGNFIVSNAKGSDNNYYDYVIADSRNATKKFEDYLQRKTFKLIIDDGNIQENFNLIKKYQRNI
jgi:hypothetical protein